MAARTASVIEEPLGIFTRTIAKSPRVRHLLQGRVRHADAQDVVFVGEDFIHVKQICDNGHLKQIATKGDFNARIRAAKIFTVDHDRVDSNPPFIKREEGSDPSSDSLPPQLLVLTLDNSRLLFLYLKQDARGNWSFSQLDLTLPKHEHMLYQPGESLAIEPRSRAVAVAASEGEIILWPSKSTEKIKEDLQSPKPSVNILQPPRFVKVDGVITQMDFLYPPKDDPDHIVLLLIVIVEERVKAIWIDWQDETDIYLAHIHPPQTLEKATSVPSLLIPIRNAAFILVCGHEIKRWRSLLTGSATPGTISVEETDSNHPGLSPKRPLWASWCRPKRSPAAAREREVIYLAREDGVVYYLEMTSETRAQTCIAGVFDCHVGSAFVSLGDDWLPDVLAMAGDMSTGQVVSIGQWPSAANFERPWIEAMEMQLVESIPNWTSVTDMITTSLPHSSSRSARLRESIFVTCGREPYGTVTELRDGIEAQQALYIEDDGLRNVTEAWALQSPVGNSILVVHTNPTSTTFLNVSTDGQEVAVTDEPLLPGLTTDSRTLALSTWLSQEIVQVTERSVCLTRHSVGTSSVWHCESNAPILCAAIHTARSVVVAGQQDASGHSLRSFLIRLTDDHGDQDMEVESIVPFAAVRLCAEPLCVIAFEHKDTLRVAVVTSNGLLQLFSFFETEIVEDSSTSLPATGDIHPASNHMVILRRSDRDQVLLVCGMRDGRALAFVLDERQQKMAILDTFETQFGRASVKVSQLESDSATLMCGLDTCRISWDGFLSFEVRNIWITDKFRPELAQEAVVALAPSPSVYALSNSNACMIVSGSEIMFAELTTQPHIIPRQIPVDGTPTRLIHAGFQRHIVVASLCTEVRKVAVSIPRNEERRCIYPAISFIPSRSDKPSWIHTLQPGELVNALAEWTYREPREGKVYSFIIVAGSYVRKDGITKGGRITFLQPKSEKWEVKGITHVKIRKFEEPVWALVMYDEVTLIASIGNELHVMRFDGYTGDWDLVCQPMRLRSRATNITLDKDGLIYLSTATDGAMTLKVVDCGEGKRTVRLANVSPYAAISLHHVDMHPTAYDTPVTLLSTREGELHGFLHPPDPPNEEPYSLQPIFHARLPHSPLRLRHAKTRPLWSPPLPTPHDPVLAGTTAGTLQVILPIHEELWRRLFWLQRLLEWESRSGPVKYFPVDEELSIGRTSRPLPIGLAPSNTSTVPLSVWGKIKKEGDMHINGDVLAGLFDGPETAKERLERIVRSYGEAKGDAISGWVSENLEKEVEAVEDVIKDVEALCFGWI